MKATIYPEAGTVTASPERRPRSLVVLPLAVIAMTVVVVVALGVALQVSQMDMQRQLATRFEARGQLAAEFTATQVTQLLDQESSAAVDFLSGRTTLDLRLAGVADVFDFRAAVILDSKGREMASYPPTPGLSGAAMASRYPFLAKAVNGKPAVSSAIVSASRGVPVVEFAVPYYTPDGRRVFSGAYELNQTPLAAVLKSITPVRGSRAFVVDGSGGIVASNPQLAKGESTMPGVLAAAYHKASKGNYDSRTGRGYYFTSAAIAGTPWSLVVTAPRDTLFAPVRGTASTVPWIALGLVALLAGGANWMMLRLLAGRHRLHVLNTALASSARTDPLTKLPNRRHLDESLAAALSSGQRHRLQVSVLVMDIDHFKHVNDTYGHTAGDRVLEHVADLLQNAFRGHDIVGRWGGEEFLAVLPHTDGPDAALIGERLRRLVQDTPFTNKAGGQIRTTLSIGYATGVVGGDKDELIHRADQALYQAKTGGRNRVRGEHSDLPLPAPEQLALVSGVLRSSSS